MEMSVIQKRSAVAVSKLSDGFFTGNSEPKTLLSSLITFFLTLKKEWERLSWSKALCPFHEQHKVTSSDLANSSENLDIDSTWKFDLVTKRAGRIVEKLHVILEKVEGHQLKSKEKMKAPSPAHLLWFLAHEDDTAQPNTGTTRWTLSLP